MGAENDVQSDAKLIRSASDDPDAFRVFYGRYAGPLHAFFARRTGSAEAALDLTAETFAQAWKSKRRFRDRAGGSAGPWLFAIARRVLMKSVSRRRLEATMLERLHVDLPSCVRGETTPDDRWLEGLDADIEAALDGLPPDQRHAIELRVLGDLTYSTIASDLGCTPTAVRIRVSRGLATLRARLEGTQR
jgi:RNA polymerase sigma factor (sigma-70 family)